MPTSTARRGRCRQPARGRPGRASAAQYPAPGRKTRGMALPRGCGAWRLRFWQSLLALALRLSLLLPGLNSGRAWLTPRQVNRHARMGFAPDSHRRARHLSACRPDSAGDCSHARGLRCVSASQRRLAGMAGRGRVPVAEPVFFAIGCAAVLVCSSSPKSRSRAMAFARVY